MALGGGLEGLCFLTLVGYIFIFNFFTSFSFLIFLCFPQFEFCDVKFAHAYNFFFWSLVWK